jgi:exodeoxyribonuclease VII large subunit
VDCLVQGEAAPLSICQGILKAELAECDVVIVGRGGGSSEDLSAYNTEAVARAVYGCKVPVISAVGHEVDFSLADLAADMRAPTPSAAAELAAPDILQLAEAVTALERRCEKAVTAAFERKLAVYNSVSASLTAQSPENKLKLMGEKLVNLEKRAETAALRNIDRHTAMLAEKAARLDGLSPLKVMARGYSLVYSGDKLVRSSADLSVGQYVDMRFDNGTAKAEIIETANEMSREISQGTKEYANNLLETTEKVLTDSYARLEKNLGEAISLMQMSLEDTIKTIQNSKKELQ